MQENGPQIIVWSLTRNFGKLFMSNSLFPTGRWGISGDRLGKPVFVRDFPDDWSYSRRRA